MTYLRTERQKIEALIARGQHLSYRTAGEQTGVSKSHIQYFEHKFDNYGTVNKQSIYREKDYVSNK